MDEHLHVRSVPDIRRGAVLTWHPYALHITAGEWRAGREQVMHATALLRVLKALLVAVTVVFVGFIACVPRSRPSQLAVPNDPQ